MLGLGHLRALDIVFTLVLVKKNCTFNLKTFWLFMLLDCCVHAVLLIFFYSNSLSNISGCIISLNRLSNSTVKFIASSFEYSSTTAINKYTWNIFLVYNNSSHKKKTRIHAWSVQKLIFSRYKIKEYKWTCSVKIVKRICPDVNVYVK